MVRTSSLALGAAFEQAPIALLVVSPDGDVLAANGVATSWLDHGEGGLIGRSLEALFVDSHDVRQLQWMLAHDDRAISVERRVQTLSGRRYWALLDVHRLTDDALPVPAGSSIWSIRDISDLHREHQIFASENERFRSLIDSALEGYVLIDIPTRTIREANPAFCQLLGYPMDDVVGQRFTSFVADESLDTVHAALDQLAEAPQRFYEARFLARGGMLVDVEVSSTTVYDAVGVASGAFALISDITERKKNEERILYLALYDQLTALPNRLLLEERLTQALKERARRGGWLGVLFLDLDNFKQVNDTLGHDVGDELLKHLARRLHAAVRQSDTVARLGGDEFIVLLPDLASRAMAAQVAAKILQALERPLMAGGHELLASCSIGIAVAPEDGDNPVTLKQQADRAMYVAKARGKHRFAFCPDSETPDA